MSEKCVIIKNWAGHKEFYVCRTHKEEVSGPLVTRCSKAEPEKIQYPWHLEMATFPGANEFIPILAEEWSDDE